MRGGGRPLPSLSEEAGMKGSESLNDGLERNLKNCPLPGLSGIYDIGSGGRAVGHLRIPLFPTMHGTGRKRRQESASSQRAKIHSALGGNEHTDLQLNDGYLKAQTRPEAKDQTALRSSRDSRLRVRGLGERQGL